MKKLIEHYSDYPTLESSDAFNKHSYIKYRVGRIRHEFWLKNRKDKNNFFIDRYDWFIVNNLKKGKTCFYNSAGYYLDDLVEDLTVIESKPIVKSFYKDAVIAATHRDIPKLFPSMFDNFVVVNNRGDHWANGIESIKEYFDSYVKSVKPNGLIFYSLRDTQIPNWNRLTNNHYEYFYNFAKELEQRYNLTLIWHDIKFSNKEKDGNGNYDMHENPDPNNGNIKFIFQLGNNSHSINPEYLYA
jgi:hypothetical protein